MRMKKMNVDKKPALLWRVWSLIHSLVDLMPVMLLSHIRKDLMKLCVLCETLDGYVVLA